MRALTPLSLAHDLAAVAPDAMVPCPVCAGPVKAGNLATHVAKKHPAVQDDTLDERWRGVDRRMNRSILWFPLPLAAAALATALLDISVVPGLVLTMASLAVMGLVGLGAFRAQLSFEEDVVVVRRWAGLRRRTVRFPSALELGGLVELRPAGGAGMDNVGSESHHAGTYLRLISGRRSVTVGCPTGTGVRTHWTGWTQGGRRRWWDVTLAAPDFVRVQYALAARGVLELRGGGRSRTGA